jgi:hypothetical protein
MDYESNWIKCSWCSGTGFILIDDAEPIEAEDLNEA